MKIHSELKGESLLRAWEAWRADGGKMDQMAAEMGITYPALRGRIKMARAETGEVGRRPRPAQSAPERVVETSTAGNTLEIGTPKNGRIKTLDELLAVAEVDRRAWEVERFVVNKWEVGAKDPATGEVIVEPLFQVKAWLVRTKPLALDFVIQPVKLHLTSNPTRRTFGNGRHGLKSALIVPDIQCGFRKDLKTGRLDPFHDRRALDVVLQVAEAHDFDEVLFLGDLLDLADFSDKFVRSPDMYFTTQPAIVELAWWLAQFRGALPGARMSALEGNHDERLPRALNSHLAAAYQLRPATEAHLPPVFSVPRLLGLLDLSIDYLGPYPHGEIWLNPTLRAEHGNKAKNAPGATAAAMVGASSVSQIFGHIHRIEQVSRTLVEHGGTRTITALSPGCVCRVDGAVPGHNLSQNWQQGFGVAHFEPNGWHIIDAIPIVDGRTVYGGQVYEARDRGADLRADTGWDVL